jgi:drug/metabolite transporter (DMT)-like permease
MKNSYITLYSCIALWAFIPVVSKKILQELNSIEMLFYSSIFSFTFMLIINLKNKKFVNIKNYNIKELLIMMTMGFLGIYLNFLILYQAFSLTTAHEAYIIAYTWPIILVLLSFIFLKEKVKLHKIIGIALSFTGVFVIFTKGNIFEFKFTNTQGNMLAFIDAIIFATFSLMGKKFKFDGLLSVFIYFAVTLFFTFINILIIGELKLPSSRTIFWIVFNGIFVNGISYILWFKALEKIETSLISSSIYLTPFLSLLYIWIFLREKILPSSIIGLILITFGIMVNIIQLNFKNKKFDLS